MYYILGLLASLSVGLVLSYVNKDAQRMRAPAFPLVVAPPIKPMPLEQFIGLLMQDCGGGLSEGASKVLSSQIKRAADTHLTGVDRYGFVAALCIETRMGSVKRARSTAGAIGVAQLMPGTGVPEAERCGYGKIVADDLYDNELNLNVAACHYAELVRQHGHEIAPLAYNAGGAAEAVAKAKRLLPSANNETMGYGTVWGIIMSKYRH